MRKLILILFIVSLTALFSISIYDIQYTTNPGSNGTYSSPYEGQIVTTGGIVTGIDYGGGRFFISSSSGGSWSGIYVYNNDQNVAVGDSVVIEAEVYEYYGFTELSNLNFCNTISSGNSLPTPVNVTTNQIHTEEEYESVLVQTTDITVIQAYDEWSEWHISDGSGGCIVSTGFTNLEDQNIPIIYDYPFSTVTGIVSFGWEDFRLNPRNVDDLQSAESNYIITIPEQYVFSSSEFELPIHLTTFGEIQQVRTYQFVLNYDDSIIEYIGFNLVGTLSSGGSISVSQPSAGSIELSFTGDFSFNQTQTLLQLNFIGVESGNGDLEFSEFNIDDLSVEYFSVEDVILQLEAIPIGDTLTVIQRPIMNIPQITIPNEEFIIECLADEATTNWTAELVHNNKTVPLIIANTFYDSNLERWKLTVSAPTPEIYELYDLVVSADGIVTDRTKNAVHLIPQRKTNYSFIHITDTHLPTHIFYPDPLSLSDSTEVEDLREVIKDINLINPEFVLLTGDMVNEGEMEDFENRRVYTKAQRLLEELDVPLYLTSGNHDIGGWDSSPPSQGTARRDWWRFFGWSWLSDPPADDPYYTQNYSFDYGPIHYIGMEAYLNYDSYLYNIYGAESFTDLQMQWLENDLSLASGSESSVIFYHFDFSDQINLNQMGIDMALYGHIHSNSGNLSSTPYNISTESTCDGNRAYRIVNVEDAFLQPSETIYAGWSGNQLQTTFTPNNIGTADSVYCYIENSQNMDFLDAQIKFNMPNDAEDYAVYNGVITQIDTSGENAVCYVSVNISANSNISVSVVAEFNVSSENLLETNNLQLTNYPNPFNPTTTISFNLSSGTGENPALIIYNLKGQKIRQFSLFNSQSSIIWNGTDQANQPVSSGIYFIKLRNGNLENTKKIMLLK